MKVRKSITLYLSLIAFAISACTLPGWIGSGISAEPAAEAAPAAAPTAPMVHNTCHHPFYPVWPDSDSDYGSAATRVTSIQQFSMHDEHTGYSFSALRGDASEAALYQDAKWMCGDEALRTVAF